MAPPTKFYNGGSTTAIVCGKDRESVETPLSTFHQNMFVMIDGPTMYVVIQSVLVSVPFEKHDKLRERLG